MMRPIPFLATVSVALMAIYGVVSLFQMNPTVKSVHFDQTAEPQNIDNGDLPQSSNINTKGHTQNLEANMLQDKAFQRSVQSIAASYAKQSRFPASSMPIPDREALQKYIPNKSFGASLPYEGPNGQPWRFGLKTNKFRYFHGEQIEIFVQLQGDSQQVNANVSVSVLANREVIHEAGKGVLSNGQFITQIDTGKVDTKNWPSEIQVMAIAEMNGETMQVVETIRYDVSIADVKSVGEGTVENEYLVIPVSIDTEKTGYFRITGVLFGAESDKPLISLEGKSKVQGDNNTIQLKAHRDALFVGGEEGPYVLKHLWVEKMPGPPDFSAAFGQSHESSYPISKHSFDEYSAASYEDPSAERSLEFLNKVSGEVHD